VRAAALADEDALAARRREADDRVGDERVVEQYVRGAQQLRGP